MKKQNKIEQNKEDSKEGKEFSHYAEGYTFGKEETKLKVIELIDNWYLDGEGHNLLCSELQDSLGMRKEDLKLEVAKIIHIKLRC